MTASRGPRRRAGQPPRRDTQAFRPENLDRSVVAIPLLEDLKRGFPRTDPEWAEKMARWSERGEEGVPRDPAVRFPVIIDLNLDYFDPAETVTSDSPSPGETTGLGKARARVMKWIAQLEKEMEAQPRSERAMPQSSRRYFFAELTAWQIQELVRRDRDAARAGTPAGPPARRLQAIYKIWPDFPVQAQLTRSVATVKADAAKRAFAALGKDIVWAVLDSGVDRTHVHFERWGTLQLEAPLVPVDFTAHGEGDPLGDPFGHGTHVAGIIAGEYDRPAYEAWRREHPAPPPAAGAGAAAGALPMVRQRLQARSEQDQELPTFAALESIAGVAPMCRILSLRVLDEYGKGSVMSLIAALEYVQQLNQDGRRIIVHGVNLSVGYEFEPEWFACGQSPLCVEVNRLVRMGCVVVTAAGNTGYGKVLALGDTVRKAGLDLTINDPGNAELAITVGSTHREEPHTYGVSYFSSKGPTGDGRRKPDVVAPGERILSCGAGARLPAAGQDDRADLPAEQRAAPPERVCYYVEQSGTSMAAPHVSGVIAGFLSVRREFIGQPERVKQIFLESATDLGRDVYFQGRGLVDLMRAIQSV